MKKTRKEAIEAVEPYYDTGKPCKHGHYSKRATIDASCYECRLERNRQERAYLKELFEGNGA